MDVDGTLYRQGPVRSRMVFDLLALPFRTLSATTCVRTVSVIRMFRKVREELRVWEHDDRLLEDVQYDETATRLALTSAEIRAVVETWIYERPLRHLRRARFPHLLSFLDALHDRRLILGVYSDYPAVKKLSALGLDGYFDSVFCSTDSQVNRFKPHRKGFDHFCNAHELKASDVLYVGDRFVVDALGAQLAGMPCAIVSPGKANSPSDSVISVEGYTELKDLLCGG